MHFSVIQRYTFYKLNLEIEIHSLRNSIKSQLIFQTLYFQAPHGNKTFLHVIVKKVVDIGGRVLLILHLPEAIYILQGIALHSPKLKD